MLEALISTFARIEDPRCGWRVEHKLIDILVIAVCAVLAEIDDDWATTDRRYITWEDRDA